MSDNNLYDKLYDSFTWTKYSDPYATPGQSEKNIKYLTNVVGGITTYNNSLKESPSENSINVSTKNYVINNGDSDIKVNNITIKADTTDPKIILLDSKNKEHHLELRTSSIMPSDVTLFSKMIEKSDGGVINNLSTASNGSNISEIISYDNDGGQMSWTDASIVVNNRKVAYGSVYIPTETFNADPLRNAKSGTQLLNLQNRTVESPVGTNPSETGTWEPTNRNVRRASGITKLKKGSSFNSRATNTDSNFVSNENNDYTFKIGDVILKVPPTHVTVTELRSADSVEVLNFMPMDTANPVSRVVIKINTVFTGKYQIDGDLKRLITQFKYVPFNIIHSHDLVTIFSSESSLLSLDNSTTIKHVPVTMDEYTLYTIEGHPNSIGCTLQFSLFNFLAYFDGDKNETFAYEAAQFDDKGQIIIPTTDQVKTTAHLENAIHPYNFDIEGILAREDKRFYKEKDLSGNKLNKDYHIESGSYARLYKLTSFQDVNMRIANPNNADPLSEIRLLCNSISIKYENIFAWHQVIGYPHACAQYIGPGLTTASINAKVSLNDTDDISRLFKTYQEFRSRDYNAIYDDRYLIISSLTDFADCNVISIADVATTSLPQHPGYMDVNIIFKRSPYLSNATVDNNKVAEQDFFWGMQRVSRAIENNPALLKVLQDEEAQRITAIKDVYSYVANWAANSNNGDPSSASYLSAPLASLINKSIDAIITEHKNMSDAAEVEKIFLNYIYLPSLNANVDIAKYCNMIEATCKEIAPLSSTITGEYQGFKKWPSISETIPSSRATNKLMTGSRDEYVSWKKFFTTLLTDYSGIFSLAVFKTVSKEDKISEVLTALKAATAPPSKSAENSRAAELVKGLLDNIQPKYDFTKIPLVDIRKNIELEHSTFFSMVDYRKATNDKMDNDKIKKVVTDLVNRVNNNNVAVFGIAGHAAFDQEAGILHFTEFTPNEGSKYTNIALQKFKVNVDAVAKETEKQIEKLNSFPPPYSAHRYYPYCDSMVALDVRFSTSVGSYYYNRLQDTTGTFKELLLRMKKTVANSVSPAFDFKAWQNIFPKDTKNNANTSSEYVNKAIEGKDPFWLMQAVSLPQAKKDIVSYKDASGQTITFNNPLMNMIGSVNNPSKDANAGNNKPFSGLSDWIFVDSASGGDVYGSPGLRNIRKSLSEKKKLSLDDSGAAGPKDGTNKDSAAAGGAKGYAGIYDAGYHYNALHIGTGLKKRSETTTGAISGMFMGTDDKGLTEYTEEITRYNSRLFSYITKIGSAYKDPTSLNKAYNPQQATPTNPTNNENTQEHKITDIVKLRSEVVSLCKSLLSKQMDTNLVLPDMMANFIIGNCIAQTGTEAFPNDFLNIVSSALKNAINTDKLNLFTVRNGKNVRELRLDSGEISAYSEFRTIKDLKQKSYCVTNNTGSTISSTMKGNGLASGYYKYIYDAALLYITSCAIGKYQNLKDATSVPNPFTSSRLVDVNVYENYLDQGEFIESNHYYQNNLVEMKIPNLEFNGASLIKSVTDTISYIRGNQSEFKNIVFTAKALSDALSKFLVNTKLIDKITNNSFTDAVSEHTSNLLISQFTQSMLPTVGMENAFPTYKMYIIDSNLSDIRFHSMDNWYDFRLVKDVMVIKSKEDPAHLLKARVVIDERFITTNTTFVQRDSDRTPIESVNKLASIDKLNTSFDHAFYQGKVPLRAGMRICLKLGYHTDPRLLDTVFIGTIVGLQGTMDKFVFDLEASGDGRELSMPATNTSEVISGLNYGEIITKILRANPSVFHLGRNYGTAIEKFTREHYLVYAFAKSCVDGALKDAKNIRNIIISGAGAGIAVGTPSLTTGALSSVSLAGLGTATAAGIGVAAAVATPFQIARMYRKLRSDGITANAWEEASQFVDKKLTGYSSNGNIFNISNVMHGHTFDNAKASGQIARHMYEVYKYGHDPIDQNIWAVDIWSRLTNIGSGFEVIVNNKKSIWDLLIDIKRVYPNYAVDVRPYGGRSTLYFGPLNWTMFRTDDPVLAMATNLEENSNPSVIDQAGNKLQELYDYDEFYNKQGNPFPSLVEFQKTHYASSDSNIIFNGIQSTPNRGWNAVAVNCDEETYQTTANAELHPSVIRTISSDVTWTKDSAVAQQYALGLLKEGVEKMYGGTLALRGNPKIEPYDRIYIMDAINKMYGWIEVETVIHKFDMNSGFTTHITPNLVCSVNSDAYKTTAQIVRSILFKEDIAGYIFKTLAGIGVGVAIGTLGTPIATAAMILGAGLMIYSGAATIKESIKLASNILGNASQLEQPSTADYQTYLHDAVLSSVGTDAFIHGMHGGFVLNYIVDLSKTLQSGETLSKVKSMNLDAWETIKGKWEQTYYGQGGLAQFIKPKGNEAANVSMLIQSLAEKINKLGGAEKELKVKDIANKGVDYLKGEELNNAAKVLEGSRQEFENGLKNKFPDAPDKVEKILKDYDSKLNEINKRLTEIGKYEAEYGKTQAKIPSAKPPKPLAETGLVKEVAKGAKGMFKIAAISALLDAVEAFPRWFENYMVNYMSKANCITITPLYSKNTLMMAGLDGWQHTSAFMHMKGLVVNAKKILSNADMALKYAMPSPIYSAELMSKMESMAASDRKAVSKKGSTAGASKISAEYLPMINKAVDNAKSLINDPCGKELLTPEFVSSIIQNESSWKYDAGKVTHATTGGLGLMQLVPTWQAGNFYNTAKAMGRTDVVSKLDNTGYTGQKYSMDYRNKDLRGGYKISDRETWVQVLTDQANVDINIQAGTNFIADRINAEVSKNGCKGRSKESILANIARNYNGDQKIDKNGARIMDNYASRVVNNIKVQDRAIKEIESTYSNATSRSLLSPVSGNTNPTQVFPVTFSTQLTSMNNAKESSAAISGQVKNIKENSSDMLVINLSGTSQDVTNKVKSGDILIGTQKDSSGSVYTAAYKILTKSSTHVVIQDGTGKTFEIKSGGGSDQWKIRAVSSQSFLPSLITPTSIIRSKNNQPILTSSNKATTGTKSPVTIAGIVG